MEVRPQRRSIARRQLLPSAIQMMSKKIGPLLALYRDEDGITVKAMEKAGRVGANVVNVRIWDDKVNTILDEDCGRKDDGNHTDPSLLNVIPLCLGVGCGYGCGCRCSHDIGYTEGVKAFEIGIGDTPGGEIFSCKTKHTEQMGSDSIPTSYQSISRIMADINSQL